MYENKPSVDHDRTEEYPESITSWKEILIIAFALMACAGWVLRDYIVAIFRFCSGQL